VFTFEVKGATPFDHPLLIYQASRYQGDALAGSTLFGIPSACLRLGLKRKFCFDRVWQYNYIYPSVYQKVVGKKYPGQFPQADWPGISARIDPMPCQVNFQQKQAIFVST
jgi:hypothetical protein